MAKKKPTPQPTLLTLATMSEFLTERFGLNYPIGYMTPYDWWWRREGIQPPFPDPVMKVGRQRLFDPEEIAVWYEKFKGWGEEG